MMRVGLFTYMRVINLILSDDCYSANDDESYLILIVGLRRSCRR